MTESTVDQPFFAATPPPDPRHPAFDFTVAVYVKKPDLIHTPSMKSDDIDAKHANDKLFRSVVSQTAWNRYILLGYQTTTGQDFARLWTERYSHTLRFHRAIWYNYLLHVDHEKDVHETLHFWATHVAQPYLILHDPASLDMDTDRFSWRALIANLERHESLARWMPVGKKPRPRSSTPPLTQPAHSSPPSTPVNDTPVFSLPIPTPEAEASEVGTSRKQQHFSPLAHDNSDINMHHDNESVSEAKRSAVIHRNDISTNDGTHRIIFKWKLQSTDFKKVTQSRDMLLSEIHNILTVMIHHDDGYLYLWGSEDLVQAKTITELSKADVVRFLAPAITTIHSHNLIIFAARISFAENPIAWKNADVTRQAMELNNIKIQVSNSISTSGKLVIAGYILFKHPTMTHRHRYLQFLRQQLPEATPYFDIVYHRQTPADQNIGHLAIQCGENHLHPLCQALSTLLNGSQTAIFLSRLAFEHMTTDQIQSSFQAHASYIKSLHQISLSPMITNLDTLRTEHLSAGRIKERSTREWALSLTLADGTHAQCDADNGGANKNTYLLVPAAHSNEIKTLLQEYRKRLQTLRHREAKFRDSIPVFPAEITFTSNAQLNVDAILRMSSADIWSKAPDSIKSPTPASTRQTSATVSPDIDSAVRPQPAWPSLVKRPQGAQDPSDSSTNKKRDRSGTSNRHFDSRKQPSQINVHMRETDARGDGATTSTHSLTNTIRSVTANRLTELESEMRKCKEMLRESASHAELSAARLLKTEENLAATMQTVTRTEEHLAFTMQSMNAISQTVSGLQLQFGDFSRALESLSLSFQSLASMNQSTTQAAIDIANRGSNTRTGSHVQSLQLMIPPSDLRPQTASSERIGQVAMSPSQRSPKKKKKKTSRQSHLEECRAELFEESDSSDAESYNPLSMDIDSAHEDESSSQLEPTQMPGPPTAPRTTDDSDSAGPRIE